MKTDEIVVADELTTTSLLDLAERRIAAIHVAGYYNGDIAEGAANKLLTHSARGTYHKELTSSVGRVHMPFVDTKHDPELTAKYHEGALDAIRDLRSTFDPYPAPIDLVRLHLDELWPSGAHVLRLRGKTCFVGGVRVFEPKTSRFYAHNDFITQETDAPEISKVSEQLVANLYLKVPEEGGELLLWLRDPSPVEQQQILEVEGIMPDQIEPPNLTLRPKAGDLILFSSKMLHAVNSVEGTHRVGAAAFIAVENESTPLRLWS